MADDRTIDPSAATELASRGTDVEIATRVAGFQWVEWDHDLLKGAPLDQPGRFLARGDTPLSHLQRPARPDLSPGAAPLRYVPRYSAAVEHAIAAAEAAGVFAIGGVRIARDAAGWSIAFESTGERIEGEALAEVLCVAALRAAGADQGESAR